MTLPDLVITLRKLTDLGVCFELLTEELDMTTSTGRGYWRSSPSSNLRLIDNEFRLFVPIATIRALIQRVLLLAV